MRWILILWALVFALPSLSQAKISRELGGPLILPANPFQWNPREDADLDCMSDEAEHIVANYFRPYYVFDSRENARRDFEPVTLYRVTTNIDRRQNPSLCDTKPQIVRIKYAYLFDKDSGFVLAPYCGTSHQGDNESIEVTLQVSADGRQFRLIEVNVGQQKWPDAGVEAEFLDGHHPTLYLSAGKHHTYLSRSNNGLGYPVSWWICTEALDGRGLKTLANLESFTAPRGRMNVGEPYAHPPTHFVGDLSFYGFFQEHAWSKVSFCGDATRHCPDHITSSMWDLWTIL